MHPMGLPAKDIGVEIGHHVNRQGGNMNAAVGPERSIVGLKVLLHQLSRDHINLCGRFIWPRILLL